MDEELLVGGNSHAEVVKVGETVRRPTGDWTPGVHALLEHLDSVGYPSAPKLLGVDEKGREILSSVSGTVVWPGHFALVESDAALAEVAAAIRWYHEAVAGFPFERFAWSDRGQIPPVLTKCFATTTLLPGISFAANQTAGPSSTGMSRPPAE